MSLSQSTLAAIQQAGQSLHRATEVVSSAVRDQAAHMVATVASQPFDDEGEQAFAHFKMLARLSQDLLALEERLRSLYATASDLANPAMDVVASLPSPSARARNNTAEDAIVKPAPARRARASKAAAGAAAKSVGVAKTKASAPRGKKAAAAKGTKPAGLTANDTKVLHYLRSVLKPGQWSTITGASVAKGAQMPLGSVGISMKKVVASGAVKQNGRSSYQLSA